MKKSVFFGGTPYHAKIQLNLSRFDITEANAVLFKFLSFKYHTMDQNNELLKRDKLIFNQIIRRGQIFYF